MGGGCEMLLGRRGEHEAYGDNMHQGSLHRVRYLRQVRLESWTLVGNLLLEPSAHFATTSPGDLTETIELGVYCRARLFGRHQAVDRCGRHLEL